MIGTAGRKHRRFTRLLAVVALLGVFVLSVGTTSAATTTPTTPVQANAQCSVFSNPAMVESGFQATESSFADVIQVRCLPTYSQDTVTIASTQLFDMCRGKLMWTLTFPVSTTSGASREVMATLDNDGNATVVAFGGPSCAPGTGLITASLNAPPFSTATTSFTALPPMDTMPGVSTMPTAQVEDSVNSAFATVIDVEYPASQAERTVNIYSQELLTRCAGGLVWLGPEGTTLGTGVNSVPVTLDDNGNAFAVAIGGPSCSAGVSLVVADLVGPPYTTFTTVFDVVSPRPLH